eukprot:1525967-Pleurochrysis_carterae.AAC.1
MEASHGLESVSAPAFDTMDQKPYGAMLRGKLPYAALALAPRSLEDIPPIADAASGTGATRAALRAQ